MLEAALAPDPDVVRSFLRHITARWDELGVETVFELRFLSADDQAKVKSILRCTPDSAGIEEATAHVVEMNRHGLNAYVVVNPIAADAVIPAGKAAADSHIVASFFHWADGDDPGAAERIRSFVGPNPTSYVLTGTEPHLRPHIYFELEEPTLNLAAWTAIQKAIVETLGTDPAVVNPSRIMRIAGTVNWPKPKKLAKGYVPEVTRLHIHSQEDRPRIPSERMARAFGASAKAAAPAPSGAPGNPYTGADLGPEAPHRKTADDFAELLQRARTDGEKYLGVRDLSASLAGQGVVRPLTEAIVREACPVWDKGVEDLIDSAYAKYNGAAPPSFGGAAGAVEIEPYAVTFAIDLIGKPRPVREFFVPGIFPRYTTSILSGPGGAGKSFLLTQLGICSSAGVPWIGREVVRGRVLYFTVEDGPEELHLRTIEITESPGIPLEAARDFGFISWISEDNTTLGALDRSTGQIEATHVYYRVRRTVEQCGADLVILDNLSDVFGGDEMVRSQAKRFANQLNRMCEELRCTVILISHPSLSGMADGTGRSGSTGWPSSVRAFWYMRRPQKAQENGDNTLRELSNTKANRGPDGEVIELVREGAIYKIPGSRSFFDLVAHRARVRDLFLKLYDAERRLGREMTTSSTKGAHTVLAARSDAGGFKATDFEVSIGELIASGTLAVKSVGPPTRKKSLLVWPGEVDRAAAHQPTEPPTEPPAEPLSSNPL